MRPSTLLLTFALIAILTIALLGSVTKYKYKPIPKVIWTYWDGKLPESVKYSIASWYQHNPGYKINILTKGNLPNVIPELCTTCFKHIDSHARFSDLVRLNVLAKYGGIWMDASIICYEPLDWIQKVQQEKNADFVAFYLETFTTDIRYPVIESWFFACTENNSFVQKWRDEFIRMNDFDSVDDYITDLEIKKVDSQDIDSLNYLAIHMAAQKVMQYDRYPTSSMYLLKAEDGPYLYLHMTDWDSDDAILALQKGMYEYKIVKMRDIERDSFDKLFHSKS